MASLFFNKGKLTLLFVFSIDDGIVQPPPLAYSFICILMDFQIYID